MSEGSTKGGTDEARRDPALWSCWLHHITPHLRREILTAARRRSVDLRCRCLLLLRRRCHGLLVLQFRQGVVHLLVDGGGLLGLFRLRRV